jgi:ML domain
MDMEFTPDFEGSDLTLLAYALLPGVDAEFQGMDDNACHWMKCPVEKGVKQTYTFNLFMQPTYPKGLFNVRWLMKKGGANRCCFLNKFKIE